MLFPFVSAHLSRVHGAVRVCRLVPFPGFQNRADSQSAVQCLVLAILAPELAVRVAKLLAVARRLLATLSRFTVNGVFARCALLTCRDVNMPSEPC